MPNLLLQETAVFDRHQFDQDEWQVADWSDQKTRHILLHIAKATGKLLLNDPHFDRVVAADSSLYRSQLQIAHNMEDIELPTTPPDTTAMVELVLANKHLADYLEPYEHGKPDEESRLRTQSVEPAITHLHNCALLLARKYGFDLGETHLNRMRSNLGDRAYLLDL